MGNSVIPCCSIGKPQEAEKVVPSAEAVPVLVQRAPPGKSPTLQNESGPLLFSHAAAENPSKVDNFYDVKGGAEALGKGSHGIVKMATHKTLGFVRALKSLPLRKKDGKVAKGDKALPTEVAVLRAMDHPNIVKLYEIYRDAKRVYLLMEQLSSEHFLDRVLQSSSQGHFTESQAAIYFEQILSAVAYMHSNNFAHRDICSENLLFALDGTVKLIDFGQAVGCAGCYMQTKVGTAHFMAPEVSQGDYTKKCDIWSCGVLLYIMHFGFPPFDGDDDCQILKAVAAGVVKFPKDENDVISDSAKECINIMLVKDVNARYGAQAIIQHATFIKSKDSARQKKPLKSIAKNLIHFRNAHQLKKICLTVIAQQLSGVDVKRLESHFKALDKNGDGTICKKELVAGLEHITKAMPGLVHRDMVTLMDTLDSDGSGSIGYTEFIAAALDRKMYQKEESLWACFRSFDTDGDGRIDKNELRAQIHGVGKTDMPISKIEEMLADADKNNDGHIDFDEFRLMILEE